MGIVFYNLFIRSLNLLLFLLSRFNSKANRLFNGRRFTFKHLENNIGKDEKILWFHCASLGEFEQGLPVMESIKSSYPDYRLYVSFFSPSGYEVQKDNVLLDCIFYLPSDTRSNSEKLLTLLDPVAVFFIKYEFWYHYIRACNDRNIPVISISAIFRPQQAFFRFYGGFYKRILYMFHHFFVQNEESARLLGKEGMNNVTITGDTRFDRVHAILNKSSRLEKIERFKGSNPLIILGSTWKPDIDLWARFIHQNVKMKYIIAPHHVDAIDIQYIENKIALSTVRYSEFDNNKAECSVLIIDNIGMLSSLYSYADISYVGGAFSEGLHNVLEPATYGKPVIIGSSKTNRKYQEVVSLMEEGGAFEVRNTEDLNKVMHELLGSEKYYRLACEASNAYVKKHLGATATIMEYLKNIL